MDVTHSMKLMVFIVVLYWIFQEPLRALYWKFKCSRDKHRLYETVGNFATGWPSTGYKCYECERKWDWDGNEREADGTGH